MASGIATLKKTERLHSKKLTEALFQGGHSKSAVAFPLRLVYMPLDEPGESAQMLVSVPKRCFKRAVKRNRIKRLVREAYRKNKSLLGDTPLALAFIWLDSKLWSASQVEQRVTSLLTTVKEKTQQEETTETV